MRCLVLLFLCFPVLLAAQQRAVWFENVGLESGLSHPYITALYRDRRGFLWIGTNGGGLNRYDGCEMKVYRHRDDDSLSLCHDQIAGILEDRAGYLWVGTNGGISRLNPANGKCENFTPQNKKLLGYYGNRLFKDPQGQIWTGNEGGVEQFDSLSRRFIRLPGSDSAKITSVAFDASGRLWGAGWKGIKVLDPVMGTFRCYYPFPNDPSKIKIDSYRNIWVLTWGSGLLRFNPQSKQFEKFSWAPHPEFPGSQNIAHDLAKTFDAEGKRIFWIATESGIFKFPLDAPDFPSLAKPHQLFDNRSGVGLDDANILVLLADQAGNLWGGSDYRGLFRYNSRQESFQEFKNLKQGGVEKLVFTKSGDILVCGADDPLVILNAQLRKKKIFHRFSTKMDPADGRNSWDVAKDETSGEKSRREFCEPARRGVRFPGETGRCRPGFLLGRELAGHYHQLFLATDLVS